MNNQELSKLEVHYGWAVLSKIRTKPAISVVFENDLSAKSERGKNQIKRLQTTVFIRKQTLSEADDGARQNRILTEYSMFLHDKKVNGNIEYLLEQNKLADINNVPDNVLDEIKSALRNGYKQLKKQLSYATEN